METVDSNIYTWTMVAALVCCLKQNSFRAVIPWIPAWMTIAAFNVQRYFLWAAHIRRCFCMQTAAASWHILSYLLRASLPVKEYFNSFTPSAKPASWTSDGMVHIPKRYSSQDRFSAAAQTKKLTPSWENNVIKLKPMVHPGIYSCTQCTTNT